ncbi:HEAT repeat domain-containing protein [Brevibacillus massiliensis]|uniref:HEAT repeat domain-containing protein n=1 Tax=Brevibacillus massiliensis TaxID=1118054 RepID=UPI0002F49905|nr:HEAT repeat domain-containing protein [Brevibacillus massiliensis]
MITSTNIAINILYVLVACNAIFMVVVYAMKLKEVKTRRAFDQFQIKFKDYLTYIQAHLHSEERLRLPNIPMSQVERGFLQDWLNDMIESFTDTKQRQKLTLLCEDLGLIEYHMQRLGSGSYRAKVDAAYHLGCMRVGEAVPLLLKMLRQHKHDSSLFVIARAVAKCARDEHDVKQMVRSLLKHEKGFHDLLVDIIQESDIDQFALFTEFVQEEHPTLIMIGLTGLKEYSSPGVASAAYRLIDHEREEIQVRAVELYLNSSPFFPKNVVHKLLHHANGEIRLLTIQALSTLRNESFVNALKDSLQDEDKRVVHASAIALINLGQTGISALCTGALAYRGQEKGEWLQGIIEEEIKHLSTEPHDLDKLTRYNALLYAYEKTLGKKNRIYRVV